jgi:sterol desaturase/sphingolipid hydroxylase (fatty acid hydroxylase superfamily)
MKAPRASAFAAHASALLGVLALVAVLCFHFPDLLTSRDIRALYSERFARTLLLAGLIVAFVLGTWAILRDRHRRIALVGLAAATLAVFLGGSDVRFETIEQTPYSLGLDWFILSLLFTAMVFVPLEHWLGRKPMSPLRPGWRTDLAYFFASHVLVQFILIVITASTTWIDGLASWPALEAKIRALPLWAQLPLAVLVADLTQALVHRSYHRVPWLWRFHAVHHSSREIDWLAGSRLHLFEIVTTRALVLLPLLLLGFSTQAVNAYVILVGLQAVFAHANLGLRFGWLEQLIVLPRYHHWHHARHPDYVDANYAIHLPLIDRLLGTYRMPKDGAWPDEYGVMELDRVPRGFFAQHLMPFRGDRRYDDHIP